MMEKNKTLKEVINKNNKFQALIFFLALFFVGLVAYGLSLRQMGFYWDDWELILLNQLTIPNKHINFYISDRPTWAWIFSVLLPFLQVSPVRWHIFIIFIRWLGLIGLYLALAGLWPKHKWQIGWICLLLMVFPGFTQTPVAATYSKHFLIFAFYSFSLALMVCSLRKPKLYIVFTLLGILASFVNVMTIEYFVGLELLRPIIIWFLAGDTKNNNRDSFIFAIKRWAPYLIPVVIFSVYRFGYFGNVSDQNVPYLLENISSAPAETIRQLIQLSLQDFVHSIFLVFANAIDVKSIEFRTLGSYALGLIVGAILVGWFNLIKDKADNSSRIVVQGLVLGLFAFLLGGLPIWTTNRQVVVGLWSDRFLLAPMVGAAILVVFLVEWLLDNQLKKSIVLGTLVSVSLAFQIRNTDNYKNNWEIEKDYYWELYWRAPALEPGTAILGPKMPFSLIADYSVGIAFNSIYADELSSTKIPYWFINTSHYLGWDIFPDYEENLPIEYIYRNIEFESNTSNGLGVTNDSGRGCVLVIDDIYKKVPGFTEYEYELFNVSHVDQIITDNDNGRGLPGQIFGDEDNDTWCYYFEKADLARQLGNWNEVGRLGDEAENLGLRTKRGLELIPFIEGYAHIENWDKALSYTDNANRLAALMQPALCETWQRIENDMSNTDEISGYVNEAYDMLECSSIQQ